MRARSYFLSTLKEAPADADVISQQYMIRAGTVSYTHLTLPTILLV